MTISKTRRHCLFVNRCLVYLFSLAGIFTGSTVAYVIALTIWIWLTDVTHIETRLINKLASKHNKLQKITLAALLH